jgi:hypothetical protein
MIRRVWLYRWAAPDRRLGVTRLHLECRTQDRHARETLLAGTDDEENVVHVHPHPAEKDQPVARTMVHEVVGHILLELDESARDERIAATIEGALWSVLTPSQRRALAHLAQPVL